MAEDHEFALEELRRAETHRNNRVSLLEVVDSIVFDNNSGVGSGELDVFLEVADKWYFGGVYIVGLDKSMPL